MITLIETGLYRLIETPHRMKLLSLSRHGKFIMTGIEGIGDILARSKRPHLTRLTLSAGTYRLYRVEDEPRLSDQLHLELEIGSHQWQGYLLPTGLPQGDKLRSRIIPTHETVTENLAFNVRKEVHIKADR
jgi:hypothetical protein